MAMKLSYDVPTPLDYFASLVQSDGNFALFEAAVSLAQDEYPELDVQAVLGEVDTLLERMRRRLPADAGPLQKLRILNQFFFRDLGFGGNVNNFYDPDNSFIHALLITRRGIPISLALLWMELAQGLGLSARGVGFPGHFMVKVNLPMGQAVIDPLSGQSLSREELSERLEPYRRPSALMEDMDAPLGLYLQSAHAAQPQGNLPYPGRLAAHAEHSRAPHRAAAAGLARIPRPRPGPCRDGKHRAGAGRSGMLPGTQRKPGGRQRHCRPGRRTAARERLSFPAA